MRKEQQEMSCFNKIAGNVYCTATQQDQAGHDCCLVWKDAERYGEEDEPLKQIRSQKILKKRRKLS
jgi:hypothetical protein